MHLHKVVPAGAGLGGGSADAAFTLVLLNRLFKLGSTEEQLSSYAKRMGSDCPFFIINKPCFVAGGVNCLNLFRLIWPGYDFVIINPVFILLQD